jgi:hypothetical protein
MPIDAERALARVDALTRGDLRTATLRKLPIWRVVSLRHQAAEAVELQGRPNYNDLRQLADDIGDLDADSLSAVMDIYTSILPELYNEEDAEDLTARANRRIEALHEIREHAWDLDNTPDLDDGPRLYLDPVGDPPYLLFYARIHDGEQLAAVQVDQPELIRSLFEKAQENAPWLSVRDPRGKVLAGAVGTIGPTTAFTQVLPHLRVGFIAQYVDDHSLPTGLFAQIFPMLLGVVTGCLAMLPCTARTSSRRN